MVRTKRIGALVVIAAILAVAIGAKIYRHVQACEPRFDERYVYVSAAGTRIARVILIPGMDGSAANFLSISTFRHWAEGLANIGADVVVLNTPIPRSCWFSDGGATYRAGFLHELDDVMADASAKHGHVGKVMITGVSYGGLHAMIGYAARPGAFIGWEASMSVTKLSALEELRAVGDVPAFNPFSEVARLKGSRGYLTWGGNDYRVDHRLTEALFAAIKSPGIVGRGYPGLAHTSTSLGVADLLVNAQRRVGRR